MLYNDVAYAFIKLLDSLFELLEDAIEDLLPLESFTSVNRYLFIT